MYDSIIAEIRAIRDEIAAEFNSDPKAYFAYLQQRQRESGETYVTLKDKMDLAVAITVGSSL